MTASKIFFSALFLTTSLGCAITPQVINGGKLQFLTSLDQSGLFSATVDGQKIAFAKDGLFLLDIDSGIQVSLANQSPVAFAWSRENNLLAVVYSEVEYNSGLKIYSDQGSLVQEFALPFAVSQLYWSLRGDLLIAGHALEVYSFGGNLQQYLYRFDGTKMSKTKLSDTTLKPHTAKALANHLEDYQPVLFTPYGDEFFYVRIHDPPEFSPYLVVLSMNWQAGEGKILLKLPLRKVGLVPGPHEDSAEVVTSGGHVSVDSWPSLVENKNKPGYRLVNGRLFDGKRLLADWGVDAQVQILSDGRYLLAKDNGLFLGSGLRPGAVQLYSEEKWTMRRWRAGGLISHDDYTEKLRDR